VRLSDGELGVVRSLHAVRRDRDGRFVGRGGAVALLGGAVVARGHVLLIGAFRSDEVSAQPLAAVLDKLRGSGAAAVQEIALPPLAGDAVDRLVADTVHRSAAEAAPLARLVREKTGGNPFFAIHFLTGLYSKRLITFDRAAGRWTWEVDGVASPRSIPLREKMRDICVKMSARWPPAFRSRSRRATSCNLPQSY
jgi:predicted ATPase